MILGSKGFSQEKGINFDEMFAPMAILEAIHILLAFASHMGIKLFQMNVKHAFLNGFFNEEVYVEHTPRFESSEFSYHIFKLHKALYGLMQATRAWCKRLRKFLIENDFTLGKMDKTVFHEN